MAFRMVKTVIGRKDETLNGIDYIIQDSAGSFLTFVDTCQTTGRHYTEIIAQHVANGNHNNLPENYLDYSGNLVSETFDEVEQKLVRIVDFDSEGSFTKWRTWMHGIAPAGSSPDGFNADFIVDASVTGIVSTFMSATESITTSTV
tara:strand:- start:410 stop:847 length:438 start_codon:yes stop_codon:yes gene_type:complete